MSEFDDTIFALGTVAGKSALQIIRISGGQASAVLKRLTGGVPKPRTAFYTKIRLGDGEVVDKAMVLFFEGGASATGEDMAELHLHGSPILARVVLEWLGGEVGCRLADRGEFSRRAFLNGKLSLDQAEGIADLIDADTVSQHRQALRQLDGALFDATETWRTSLIALSGQLEALIDFADEDLPDGVAASVITGIDDLLGSMERALASSATGLINRDGFRVVILGRPNAGKSTFLNRLVGHERAIVSSEAGTTRDLVQVSLDLDGIAVHLTDTAGIREESDGAIASVEQEGIRRAVEVARGAHLVLLLIDHQDEDVEASYAQLCNSLKMTSDEEQPDILPILTKADLLKDKDSADLPDWLRISAQTGEGMAVLDEVIKERVRTLMEGSEAPLLTRHRHIMAVKQGVEALKRARAIDLHASPELLAEEFRLAATSLGRISGRVDVEDLLDHIFGHFCIGK